MKKLSALLLALAMVFALASCGSTGTQSAGSAASTGSASASASTSEEGTDAEETTTVEPVTLNIGYMANYASLWGVLSAIDQGYFEEEGITVNLWEFADGPSEIAAMEGGSIDLAYIGKGAHKLCITGSAVIFAPSSVHTSDTIVVSADSGIESLADLAGKKIAYASGTSSDSTLDSALTLAGLTRDDVELYDMDVSYMVSAMVSGSVDAAVAWNPYTSQMLEQSEGSKEIEFSNGSINLSSWICLPDYTTDNYDVLVRFTRALLKGMDWGAQSENWEAVAQLCADQTKTDLDVNLAQTGDAVWFDVATIKADLEDGTLKEYYEHLQQDFLDGGTIEESDAHEDVSDFVLFDVLADALSGI